MNIRVVVSGRSYDAAASIPQELPLADGTTLDEVLETIAAMLPVGKGLPASCLVAVSGTHLGTVGSHQNLTLADGDELVLIAPVAGG